MVEVLAGAATGLLALLTAVIVELIRRTGKVVTQVQNGHKDGPSLRDDITNISKKVDQIHIDLSIEREDRRDLARAHQELAETVTKLRRECPLIRSPAPGRLPEHPPANGTPPPPPESSSP